VTVTVVEVPAEKMTRLLVGEDATVWHVSRRKRRHHPGITVHPAKLDEMVGAQAFGGQAVSVEGSTNGLP
jgi:hypothetical protein